MHSAFIYSSVVAVAGAALFAALLTLSVVREPLASSICTPDIQYYVDHVCTNCALGGGCIRCDPITGACLECPAWYNISGTGCLRSNGYELCQLAPFLPEGCANCTLACDVCGASCNEDFEIDELDLGDETLPNDEVPLVVCDLQGLATLDVSNTGISEFPACFATLTAMRDLTAAHNPAMNITNVPPALTALDMHFTPLADITPLCAVTTLEELNLCDCGITEIPYCFGALTALRELYLCNNLLSTLPDSFQSLAALTYLDLKNNLLPDLDFAMPPTMVGRNGLPRVYFPNTIGELHALTTLDVSDNELISLPDDIGGLTALRFGYFANNYLQELPDSFGNVSSLVYLDLSSNNLTALPSTIDGARGSLQFLYLQHNVLTALPDTLGNLTGLTTIDLHTNLLSALPATIGSLSNVVWLDIGANFGIVTLPTNFGGMTSLVTLHISPNRIVTLPATFGNLTSLVTLDISTGNLNALVLPAEFCKLSSLESLSIVYNPHFHQAGIPDCFGSLSSLKTLDLSHSSFATTPVGLSGLAALTSLDLHSSAIVTLSPQIGNITSLRTLILSSNSMASLPSSIGSLRSLTSLMLYTNALTALPNSIGSLTSLNTLNLNGNALTGLPAGFASLTSLTWLDIGGHNNAYAAGAINDALFNNIPLQQLHIADAHLTTLPASIYTRTNLTYLYAPTNPLLDNFPDSVYWPNLTYFNIEAGSTYSDVKPLVRFPLGLCNSTKLQTLRMYYKAPTSLPNCFDKFTSLIDFAIHTSNLTAMPSSFNNLAPTLTSLTLSGIYLPVHRGCITSINVSQLTALTTLSLGTNQLTALPGFENLESVTAVDLAYSNLTTLPDMSRLTRLTALHLTLNSRLTSLPASMASCSLLTYLSVFNVATLADFYAPFTSFPLLDRVYGGSNVQFNQPPMLAGLSHIRQWWVGGTRVGVAYVPAPDVSGLVMLGHFDMAARCAWSGAMNFDNSFKVPFLGYTQFQMKATHVTSVSASGAPYWPALTNVLLTNNYIGGPLLLHNVTLLTNLDLTNNFITSIGNFTTTLLRSVQLYNNQLSVLPEGMSSSRSLTLLGAATNLITALPTDIGSLTHLITLSLHHNRLTSVALLNNLGALVNLTSLELHYNLLTTIPAGFVNCTAALTTLNLDYNFINCAALNATLPHQGRREFIMSKCNPARQYTTY